MDLYKYTEKNHKSIKQRIDLWKMAMEELTNPTESEEYVELTYDEFQNFLKKCPTEQNGRCSYNCAKPIDEKSVKSGPVQEEKKKKRKRKKKKGKKDEKEEKAGNPEEIISVREKLRQAIKEATSLADAAAAYNTWAASL